MKKLYILLTFCFFALVAQAQEEYIFTQYFLNPATINPGATGFEGTNNILFNYRNNWSGFPDSPQSYQANYNGEVAPNVGLGANLLSDQFANLGSVRADLSFAYMIKGESYKIGAGISTRFQQYRVSGVDLGNPLVDESDEMLLDRLNDGQFFETSLGFHGLLSNGLFFDLAFPSLVRSQLNNPDDIVESSATFNYFFGLGYPFQIRDYDMVVEPSFYVKKFRNVPLHVDFNALMKFMDGKLLSGITYSNGADNRLGFLIGTQINTLAFNYSYNISFHDFQQFNNGGHEIGLALKIGQQKEAEKMPAEK